MNRKENIECRSGSLHHYHMPFAESCSKIIRNVALSFGALSFFAGVSAQTPFSATGTPASNLKIAKDFKADLLYTVPKENQGSWVAMCTDPKGRLIVSDQYGKLFRLTLPPLNSTAAPQIETIDLPIGCAQGLLYAFDSLYVMVNEERFDGRGLYRVRDTNNDDKFDEV